MGRYLSPQNIVNLEGDKLMKDSNYELDSKISFSAPYTRRRFLHLTGGSAGLAGCTRIDSNSSDTLSDIPSTLIATWRGYDPTSAVTLQWISPTSDPPEPKTVKVSSEGNGLDAADRTTVELFGNTDLYGTPDPTEFDPKYRHPLYRHRAVLTDLESDTRYRITIDELDTGLFVRTAPKKLIDSLVFAEGGDIGTSSIVPQLHEQVAKSDPLFGLVGGDIAYADARHSHNWITFLEHWHEHMRSGDRLIPIVAAIGDHETENGLYDTPNEAPFFYDLFDNPYRKHAYWALDIGDYLSILILDSNHSTKVAGAQTQWLERALSERTKREYLMVAYHIPAYPSVKPVGEEGRGDIRKYWVPLLQEYNVDLVFEHDDHTYKRTHPLWNDKSNVHDGILYVGGGAWGREPRNVNSSDERPYLAVSKSALHVLRVNLLASGTTQFQSVGHNGSIIDQVNDIEGNLPDESY